MTKNKDTTGKLCDCGLTAVHYFNGWECLRCFQLRRHYEHTQRKVEEKAKEQGEVQKQ